MVLRSALNLRARRWQSHGYGAGGPESWGRLSRVYALPQMQNSAFILTRGGSTLVP